MVLNTLLPIISWIPTSLLTFSTTKLKLLCSTFTIILLMLQAHKKYPVFVFSNSLQLLLPLNHNILLTRLSPWFGIQGSALDWFKSLIISLFPVSYLYNVAHIEVLHLRPLMLVELTWVVCKMQLTFYLSFKFPFVFCIVLMLGFRWRLCRLFFGYQFPCNQWHEWTFYVDITFVVIVLQLRLAVLCSICWKLNMEDWKLKGRTVVKLYRWLCQSFVVTLF